MDRVGVQVQWRQVCCSCVLERRIAQRRYRACYAQRCHKIAQHCGHNVRNSSLGVSFLHILAVDSIPSGTLTELQVATGMRGCIASLPGDKKKPPPDKTAVYHLRYSLYRTSDARRCCLRSRLISLRIWSPAHIAVTLHFDLMRLVW